MRTQTLGEKRFAWLLRQRGIPAAADDDLWPWIPNRRKKPDFLIMPSGSHKILAEVEDLQQPGLLRRATARVYATGPRHSLQSLRSPLARASKQLKPYQDLKIPMLVIIDNAARTGTLLGPEDMVSLVGAPEVHRHVCVAKGEWVGPARIQGAPDSFHILTPNRNPYISAVAVNIPKAGYQYIEPPDQERPMRLRVLHNPYAKIPLPLNVFSDPEDEHIAFHHDRWLDALTGHPLYRF